MTFEKLHAMPSHVKGEGGYYYENKYVNKIFQYENKLLYFTENSFHEFPLELYNCIIKNAEEKIEELKFLLDEIENKLKTLATYISNHAERLENLDDKQREVASEEKIIELIDKKLESVYKSFEKLSEKFVKDNMNNALKDSKREASGKLKITSLAIFKELGYDASEIKSLADSGLI